MYNIDAIRTSKRISLTIFLQLICCSVAFFFVNLRNVECKHVSANSKRNIEDDNFVKDGVLKAELGTGNSPISSHLMRQIMVNAPCSKESNDSPGPCNPQLQTNNLNIVNNLIHKSMRTSLGKASVSPKTSV